MKIVRMMDTANGAFPIIFTIILVHSISYIKPERPERKKQEITRINILLVVLSEIFFLAIFIAAISEKDSFFQEALIEKKAVIDKNSLFVGRSVGKLSLCVKHKMPT